MYRIFNNVFGIILAYEWANLAILLKERNCHVYLLCTKGNIKRMYDKILTYEKQRAHIRLYLAVCIVNLAEQNQEVQRARSL